MARIILIIPFLIFSIVAQAQSRSGGTGGYGIYLEETFFPEYVDKNDTSSVTTAPGVATETGLGFDTRTTLGYMFYESMFLVGFTYNYYNLATDRKNVSGGSAGLDESTVDTKLGPTLGWFYGGFRTLFTFWMSGEKEVSTRNFDGTGTTANRTLTNTEISGFQLTLGYTFLLWDTLEIGPSLVYNSVSYEKQSNSDKLVPGNNYNVTLFSEKVDTQLTPMLSLVARF